MEISEGKIQGLINEKPPKFNEKNEEQNQKIEFNLLVLEKTLRKSCKDD